MQIMFVGAGLPSMSARYLTSQTDVLYVGILPSPAMKGITTSSGHWRIVSGLSSSSGPCIVFGDGTVVSGTQLSVRKFAP